jgi:hypothetical protein
VFLNNVFTVLRLLLLLLLLLLNPFIYVLTQPLARMSIRNLPGVKGRLARKADNLTAICEPIV